MGCCGSFLILYKTQSKLHLKSTGRYKLYIILKNYYTTEMHIPITNCLIARNVKLFKVFYRKTV